MTEGEREPDPADSAPPDQRPAVWMDEAWSAVLVVPAVAAFVPGLQDVVSRGFVILSVDAPAWYLAALAAAMAWGFGKRAWPDIAAVRRGR